MSRSPKMGRAFYLCAAAVLMIAAAKIYLNFIEDDHQAAHAEMVERIEAKLRERASFRFAVVGNIQNSVGIFERKILPQINRSGVDFVISAGNAVSGGGEDKYRALHRSLSQLRLPYLLAFGDKERSGFGSNRFYDHYGPYCFSFSAANSHFLFLDSTGKTSWEWQMRQIEDELSANRSRHVFAFSSRPVRLDAESQDEESQNDRTLPAGEREQFAALAERFGLRAVFSASLPTYAIERAGTTDFVVTGGAGGLVRNDARSYYHYVEVKVDGDQVTIEPVRLDIGQSPIFRTLESFWLFVHSLLYVGYLNYLLALGIALLFALWFYRKALVDRDYYPRFDLPADASGEHPMRVAMFTNNYLPFIGGVPISIDRLRRSLAAFGHNSLVVAPSYADASADDSIYRLPRLPGTGKGGTVRVANIFNFGVWRTLARFKPDIVHLHHPFWVGTLGLVIARCRRLPVVYTYHTRLENFSYAVPLPSALFRNFLAHSIIRRFSNRCDAVIVPTDSAEHYLRMIGVKSPIHIQPTGIDYERFRAASAPATERLRAELNLGDDPALICVARLSKEKNIGFVIDAAALLKRRSGRCFTLLIIGDGPERQQLQERIDALGASSYIRLLGAVPQDDVPAYYKLGAAFVFASQAETQGMVILEAMAAGLAVVAVRSSGIDDFITDGYNGYKTLLHADDWTERVERLLSDPDLRRELGTNATALASRYDLANYGRNVARIYAQTIALRVRPGQSERADRRRLLPAEPPLGPAQPDAPTPSPEPEPSLRR